MYNTNELQTWASRYIKNFAGIYARLDPLPIYSPPLCFILNTDTTNLPGQHWVCVYIHSNGICEYFDSFGGDPNPWLGEWINTHCTVCYYSRHVFQSINSTTCGLFCLYYLYNRSVNTVLTYKQFLSLYFSIDVSENETNIVNFFNE